MNTSPETTHQHHRHSIRYPGYDYSQNGAYFITICTRNKKHLFGEIENGEMRLNDTGYIAQQCWYEIPRHYPHVSLGAFVVMPNHIHGIIVINNNPKSVGAPLVGALFPYPHPGTVDDDQKRNENSWEPGEDKPSPLPTPIGITLGNIVGTFKSLTANEYIRRVKTKEFPRFEKSIWQRNYYEHIIRDDREWNLIVEYIEKNPEMWEGDEMFSR